MGIRQHLMLDTHAGERVGIEVMQPAERATATAAGVGQAFTLEPDQNPVINGRGRGVHAHTRANSAPAATISARLIASAPASV